MTAREELSQYRAGTITFGELTERWARRRWKKKADVGEIQLAEATPVPQPGTWDEVEELVATGELGEAEYWSVSAAVDAAARKRAVNQE